MPLQHGRELGRAGLEHLEAVIQLFGSVGGADGGAQVGHAFGTTGCGMAWTKTPLFGQCRASRHASQSSPQRMGKTALWLLR